MNKVVKVLLLSLLTITLSMLLLVIGVSTLIKNIIVKEVKININDKLPTIEKFVLTNFIDLNFSKDYFLIDTKNAGIYDVNIYFSILKFKSKLKIIDNIAPTADVIELKIPLNTEVNAEKFVKNIKDNSKVIVKFIDEPDFSKLGEQIVNILLEDEFKNKTKLQTKLFIYEDKEAPIFYGIKDLVINAGDPIYYRDNVRVYDNFDNDIDFSVDLSNVNLNKSGIYPIIYKAKDRAGNKTQIDSKVIVKGNIISTKLDENLDAELNYIISNIINEDMSYIEKLKAVYDYVNKNLVYVDNKLGENFKEYAYNAIILKKGDCYNFAALSKYLLDKIGVESKYIKRIENTNSTHYWLLVKYNGQWYHFDALNVNFRKKFECFMKTDEEIQKFTKEMQKIIPFYYEYDKESYPEVSKEKIEYN